MEKTLDRMFTVLIRNFDINSARKTARNPRAKYNERYILYSRRISGARREGGGVKTGGTPRFVKLHASVLRTHLGLNLVEESWYKGG